MVVFDKRHGYMSRFYSSAEHTTHLSVATTLFIYKRPMHRVPIVASRWLLFSQPFPLLR